MPSPSRSLFQQSAIASGILTEAQLEEAANLLAEEVTRQTGHPVTDEQLSEKLVELGYINRWQAQQLRGGRTKFNLGPYQIVDSIGRGGMGEVYKAEHQLMGRTVAIKVLPRHRSTPETIASFVREIRAQAQLDHENLVRAYDAGEDGNVHFLVTEYVPGSDLRRLIRRQGKMSMRAAASIIIQAARGLEHAHSRGLIHRDVKPGNILVTADGRAKVSDLGLAAYFSESDEQDVRGGKVVGTADYLAPEQITAPETLCAASDIYSLGCTLYYTVTGKVPFPGGTAREKARAHIQVPPWNPKRFNAELDDEFVEIIADMMAKSVDKRISSASEVIARLTPYAEGPASLMTREFSLAGASGPSKWSEIGETAPNFGVDDDWIDESSGQVSHSGRTLSAFDEETAPVLRYRPESNWRRWRSQLPPLTRYLMLAGIAAVVSAFLLIIIDLIINS